METNPISQEDRFFVIGINPDPWAIGPLSVGRRNGKVYPMIGPNLQVVAYKEALKEHLDGAGVLEGEVEVHLYVWRRLDTGTVGDRKKTKHYADATNIQKATEDALQGVLITNDKNVKRISTEIIEQTSEAQPCIVIRVRPYEPFDPDKLPDFVWRSIADLRGGPVEEILPWSDLRSDPLGDVLDAFKKNTPSEDIF